MAYYLEIFIETHPSDIVQKSSNQINQVLKQLLDDADSKTRNNAKICFFKYNGLYPKYAMKLISSLPSYVRKTLDCKTGDFISFPEHSKHKKSSFKKCKRNYSKGSIENSVSHSEKSLKTIMSKTNSKGYNKRSSYDIDNDKEIYISDKKVRHHDSKPKNMLDKRFSSKLPCSLGVSKKYIDLHKIINSTQSLLGNGLNSKSRTQKRISKHNSITK